MRILLSGGGTAGHINPAIAIAEIVKEHCPDAAIAFVGTKEGMENELVGRAGFPIYHVRAQGLQRSLSPSNLRALWLAATSPRHATKILAEFRPDLVIGTGGYVCYPLLRAAVRAGVPTALHESNAVPGLAVRRLSSYVDALWLNFRESAAYLPHRCVSPTHTGNPLRHDFAKADRAKARAELGIPGDGFAVLSFGGSLGAEELNRAMMHFMKTNAQKEKDIWHFHACGTRHFSEWEQDAPHGRRTILLPYIDKMATYMAAADVVICRAGAMTLSELALCGKCAILVPSPYVAGDHQRKNAMLLTNAAAAYLCEEHDLPKNKVGKLILSIKSNRNMQKTAEHNIRQFAMPNANRIIYEQICRITAAKP